MNTTTLQFLAMQMELKINTFICKINQWRISLFIFESYYKAGFFFSIDISIDPGFIGIVYPGNDRSVRRFGVILFFISLSLYFYTPPLYIGPVIEPDQDLTSPNTVPSYPEFFMKDPLDGEEQIAEKLLQYFRSLEYNRYPDDDRGIKDDIIHIINK